MIEAVVTVSFIISLLSFLFLRRIRQVKVATINISQEIEKQFKPESNKYKSLIKKAVIAILVLGIIFFAVPSTPVLTTITVSPATASVVEGDSEAFTALILDQVSKPITTTVTWSSSNTAVGTIDSTGKFTALAPGNTTITASSGSISGTAIVTVPEPVLTSINVSPETGLVATGTTERFVSETRDQNNHSMAVTVTWSSSDKAVGTIDSTGEFTALAVGTTTITASSGSVSGKAIVTVRRAPRSVPTPELTNITVLPENASVVVGNTEYFVSDPRDQYNHSMAVTVTWLSSNTTVGTIDSTGKFTTLAPGKTIITASSGSVSGTANTKVIELPAPASSQPIPIGVQVPTSTLPYVSANRFVFIIPLFLILLTLLVAVAYHITRKKEPMMNSLEIPTKMYEGDSDIVVLRLAEWIAFASNGKAKTLFFIDAHSKRQPLKGIEIPSAFSPKFIEVELLAPGFGVEGEKRQKNDIFIAPMTYQWGICPLRPGNYEIGLVFRFEDTSGRVGELGVITHKMNVVKIFGLSGRQIGGLTGVSQIITWILAIILALNKLGFKLI